MQATALRVCGSTGNEYYESNSEAHLRSSLQSIIPTTVDLNELLKKQEGKTLEFKRDFSSRVGLVRTLVAFANTAGGVLLIGVDDGTGTVRGVDAPLDLAEAVASIVSDTVTPSLIPEIELLPFRGKQVLAVQVHLSQLRPHHVKAEGPQAGVYVRVGSTNRRADADLIEEIRRSVRGEGFDEQAMQNLNSEAIDFRAASELFSHQRTLKKRDLETLRLVTSNQGRKVPTVGGVILFGQDRLSHFPDAWIQAGRFSGTDRARIVDRTDIRSYPVKAIEEAIQFVEKHTLKGAEIGRVHRQERWNLPSVAVREAVINAVAHADYALRGAPIRVAVYDDRLEIENPGLLPFGLTVEDLERGVSKLRNRVIGRVFHELGLIEQWGSGIQRMISACVDAGLPPPKFEEIANRFRVTIFSTQTHAPALDTIDERLIEQLSAGHGLSTSDLAASIGLSTRATRSRLAHLVEARLVAEVGTSPNDPKRRYHLAQ